MAQRARVEEIGSVDLDLSLRELRRIERVGVVPDSIGVEEGLSVQTALGGQHETAVLSAVKQRSEERRGDHLRILHFPGVLRSGLVPGGRLGMRHTRTAAQLHLVASQVPDLGGVGRQDLRVQLGVEVLERRLVQNSAGRHEIDLVAAVGAPEPQAVFPGRAAHFDSIVLNPLDVVPIGQTLAGGFGRDVFRLEALVDDEDSRRAVQRVRAALRDHVQVRVRPFDRGVSSPGDDLHFLKRIEVVVDARSPGSQIDAVHLEGAANGALARKNRLLARLGSSHVDAIDLNARNRLKNDPGIARGRNVPELFSSDGGPRLDSPRIDERSLVRNLDDRRDGRQLHRKRELGVPPDRDGDVFPVQGREALPREDDRVAARGEADDVKLAPFVRRRNQIRAGTLHGHRDSGEDRALLVDDLAVDSPGRLAGLRDRAGRQEATERRGGGRPKRNGHKPSSFPGKGGPPRFPDEKAETSL